VNECVKGEPKADLLKDQVMEHFTASPNFDPASADSVKTEKEKILAVLKARKEYLAAHGINFESGRPDGKGSTNVDSGSADALAAKREAFDTKNPDFAVRGENDLDIVRGGVLKEGSPKLTAEWMEVYGPQALKTLPLGK